MLLTIVSTTATTSSDPTTGLAALTSLAVIPTIIWGLVAGWAAAWLSHRYRAGEDAEGFEIAVLGDATCPHCDHVITAAESSPGRSLSCAACSRRLPFTWLGTQLAVLGGCIAMLATWGPGLRVLPFLWLVPVLICAAVTDLRTMLIPKRIVWVGLAIGLASIVAVTISRGTSETVYRALIGSALYFGFLFVAHLVMPSGMGFGDVRLALLLGLYLGWVDLRLPLFGLLIGNIVYLLYAVPQRIRHGKEGGRFSPFGPGLAAGTLLAVFFSAQLIGG